MIFRRTIPATMMRNWIGGAFAAFLLVGGAWLGSEMDHFRKDEASLRTDLVEGRKNELRDRVVRTVDLVALLRSHAEERARETTRAQVYQAHATAAYIRNKYLGAKSDSEIRSMILDALRPVRFNDGRGYLFVFSPDGLQHLNGNRPDLEGKNLIGFRDSRGTALFRDMADIAHHRGEGFHSYRWGKPEAPGRDFRKFSYVKYFGPYDWIIGAGEYLDDVEEEIQAEALDRIGKERFGRSGSLFAGTLGGTLLSTPSDGATRAALTGGVERPLVGELVARVREGGGFSTVPSSGGGSGSICYSHPVAGRNWYVAATSGLDDIDLQVARARQILVRKVWGTVGLIGAFLAALFLGAVAAARYTAAGTTRTFETFSAFFRKAATEAAVIDPEGLAFTEFQELAESANRMVAERRNVEARVARLAAAVEQAAEDIVITDVSGVIQYVNPSFERSTGYTPDEVVGKSCAILSSRTYPHEFYEEMWRTIRAGKPWKGQFRNRTKDGRLILQDANIAPIFDRPGTIAGYISVRRDVTEQAEMEARLANSHRLEAIGTLAGGIAHDFNNILTAIVGYTEIAFEGAPPESPLRENLDQIRTAGRRATDLVKQILAFSRKDRQDMRPTRVDVVLRETLNLLRAAVPSTVEFVSSISSEAKVLANPTQLYQVAMNLCTNAAVAMKDGGGTLRVYLRDVTVDDAFAARQGRIAPGRYLLLAVEDTGCGMTPEVREHIFEPFFTTRPQGEGTGMGLSVVHGIVHSHGGTITVSSEPGEGSAFHVYLPIHVEGRAVEARREEAEEAPLPGGERVLFVDDEEAIAELAVAQLGGLGYRVTPRTDSEEALRTFRGSPYSFDIVISDMTMPRMTGDRLAEGIRSIRPDIPVILCSGFTDRMTVEKAMRAGISDFITKPTSRTSLSRAVRKALDKREPERSREESLLETPAEVES